MTINSPLPASLMPAAKISRIHWHWTAGTYAAAQRDASGHYHFVYGPEGERYIGKSIALNTVPVKAGYAAHTLNANAGAIGLSVAGMAGAVESPFNAGKYPFTVKALHAMLEDTVTLCNRYGVPVSPRTTLSHAEVERNLGIRQRGKWDIARFPWAPGMIGAPMCGDWMRAFVTARLVDAPKFTPADKPERYVVRGIAGRLNFRRSPNGEVIGSLGNGDVVEKLNDTATAADFWWNVRTLRGYVGWVASDYLVPEPE